MAIRFDNTADQLYRTTNVVNYNTPWSACGWLYCVADATDSYNTVFIISDDGNFPNAEGIDWRRTSGTTRRLLAYSDNGTYMETLGTTNLSLATWYFWASVRETNFPGTYRVYLGTLGGSSITLEATVSQSGARASAAARMEFGTFNAADLFDGRIAGVKAWSAALTTAELLQEMHTLRPVRTENLALWLPTLVGGTRTVDYSGGGSLTESGLADEDNPPVSWGAPSIWLPFTAAAGGTQYTQDASGALATAGTVAKRAATAQAGTLTTTGAVAKRAATSQAGALSTAGTLANQAQKVFTGTLDSAGALAKRTVTTLAGTLSTSGALSGVRAVLVSISGTLASSGALTKQAQIGVAGVLSSAGTISRSIAKALSGALSVAGALVGAITGTSTVGSVSVTVAVPSVAIAVTAPGVTLAVAAPSVAITVEPI